MKEMGFDKIERACTAIVAKKGGTLEQSERQCVVRPGGKEEPVA